MSKKYIKKVKDWIRQNPGETALLVVAGLIIAFIHVEVYSNVTNRSYLEQNGVETTAEIEAISNDLITYSYQVENKTFRTQTPLVDNYTDNLRVGHEIDAYYLADQPNYSEIQIERDALSLTVLAVIDASILMFVIFLREKKKKPKEIPLGD